MMCFREGCELRAPFYVTNGEMVLPMCLPCAYGFENLSKDKKQQLSPSKLRLMPGEPERWWAALREFDTIPPFAL